ncbi:anthrone oxygenase family protein [Granulosicoccus sp. 3-233]|uniref:anthrone oxygenase family protein n=1 Tax=Granulosicoccus sp. 3-233 TaxID=3417969 RepID=UPI003D32B4CF
MFDSLLTAILCTAAIGAGLMAGVYFAFSAFIMRALDSLDAGQATDAMIAINSVILRSWFMVLFTGSTLLYAMLSIMALVEVELPGRWLLFFTGLIYVSGMFLCTVVFNVPLNERLTGNDNDGRLPSGFWSHYVDRWTRWNHLRCICSLAALGLSMHYLMTYS